MEGLIWIGAAVSLIGLAGIIACIVAVLRIRRSGLTDAQMRARLGRVVALNMGALFVSVLGLMLIVIGVTLT